MLKTRLIEFTYKNILKKLLFLIDAERVHNSFILLGNYLGNKKLFRYFLKKLFFYQNSRLAQNIIGFNFPNPIGLSAGFDKDAKLIEIAEQIGFGFIEVGSITARPCKGNIGKRIERLPENKSIWVNLGLNNEGVEVISKRLINSKTNIPLLVSIAKTNCKENADNKKGLEDYISSLKILKELKKEFIIVLNISCPNAFGGQPFSNPSLLKSLLKEVKKLNLRKPIFIKISPDMSKNNLDKIISLAIEYSLSGIICSNLTKLGLKKGGLSGKSLEEKSNHLISYVYKKVKCKMLIIGVGGVFSAEDAYKKIKSGANLVSLITGMIYEGPQLIGNINQDLINLLNKDSFDNISSAVGSDLSYSFSIK